MTDVVTTSIDDEQQDTRFVALVRRLSEQSVVKHFDAYADVPWDDPEYRIDPEDPRWEMSDEDPLGATEWYRAQPQGVRARLGLQGIGNLETQEPAHQIIIDRGREDDHRNVLRPALHEPIEFA